MNRWPRSCQSPTAHQRARRPLAWDGSAGECRQVHSERGRVQTKAQGCSPCARHGARRERQKQVRAGHKGRCKSICWILPGHRCRHGSPCPADSSRRPGVLLLGASAASDTCEGAKRTHAPPHQHASAPAVSARDKPSHRALPDCCRRYRYLQAWGRHGIRCSLRQSLFRARVAARWKSLLAPVPEGSVALGKGARLRITSPMKRSRTH